MCECSIAPNPHTHTSRWSFLGPTKNPGKIVRESPVCICSLVLPLRCDHAIHLVPDRLSIPALIYTRTLGRCLAHRRRAVVISTRKFFCVARNVGGAAYLKNKNRIPGSGTEHTLRDSPFAASSSHFGGSCAHANIQTYSHRTHNDANVLVQQHI